MIGIIVFSAKLTPLTRWRSSAAWRASINGGNTDYADYADYADGSTWRRRSSWLPGAVSATSAKSAKSKFTLLMPIGRNVPPRAGEPDLWNLRSVRLQDPSA